MRKTGIQLNEIEAEHILELMDIYLSEWKHRDEVLWKQVFKYFYTTLVVIFLPNLTMRLGIDLNNIPPKFFPIAGLLLSIVFLYVSIGCCKRAEASYEAYKKINSLLPYSFRRIQLSDPKIKYGKYFDRHISLIICPLMFFALLFLSIVMIVYHS